MWIQNVLRSHTSLKSGRAQETWWILQRIPKSSSLMLYVRVPWVPCSMEYGLWYVRWLIRIDHYKLRRVQMLVLPEAASTPHWNTGDSSTKVSNPERRQGNKQKFWRRMWFWGLIMKKQPSRWARKSPNLALSNGKHNSSNPLLLESSKSTGCCFLQGLLFSQQVLLQQPSETCPWGSMAPL